MQTSDSKRVKKPWTVHSSLMQMRYRRKRTLQRMLHSYFDDCRCKGVYLLIHEDNRYFTINFNKLLQKQEKHYPPPSRTTCENYRKYQKSRAGKKVKQGKLEQKQDG
ncbi:uncharacterized protein PADG_07404 [Paracoccidioides brasiliensis Pb18]|uniref:Uncharacterized protein n=1 Tax=Paracoccidioides brasiliensis (strain Pb18) TaxID=502780 RepID=C1GJG8_PARBD|nr:uncharacterized protein PADG_07404 [Paracoccidioides brasiliensis Pb18]EEH42584.2 hypothetical protein PADG_07404 [Paracoccidioides brasiliensis Pb18]